MTRRWKKHRRKDTTRRQYRQSRLGVRLGEVPWSGAAQPAPAPPAVEREGAQLVVGESGGGAPQLAIAAGGVDVVLLLMALVVSAR